jgi:hypothetical protein
MTPSTLDMRAAVADIAIALVPGAWARACRAGGRASTEPRAITTLKRQKPGRKSGAYRLEGLDTDVVAKRCSRASALLERQIYQHVLPATGLPFLAFHGYADDITDPAYCWLFVEYAGPAHLMERDRAVVADWLARLHVSCVALADVVSLPERGSDHYLEQLRAARGNIQHGIEAGGLSASERAKLALLRRQLDRLEARWEAMTTPCAILPRTLVHGDLARKNCRLHATPDGPAIVLLDWETAGWGPPAADLAEWSRPPKNTPGGWGGTVALDAYASRVAGAWPRVTLRDIQQQARIGTVFRLIAAVLWASELLPVGGGARAVIKLAWLSDRLAASEEGLNA